MTEGKHTERLAIVLSAAAFCVLIVTLVVVLITLSALRSEAAQAVVTHNAACSYMHFLQQQASGSEAYLRNHPNGAPALGITSAQIQQNIDRERAAVQALSSLRCSN